MEPRPVALRPTVRRSLVVLSAVALVALLLWMVSAVAQVLLLAFAGILLAIFLRGLAVELARRTGWPVGVALAVVGGVLLGLLALGVVLLGPDMVRQVARLARRLPELLSQLREWLGQSEWGRTLLEAAPEEWLARSEDPPWLGRLGGAVSSLLTLLGAVLFVAFTGLYLAAEPHKYLRGLERLVAPARRERAREVLGKLEHTLRWWLYGRLLAMMLVGVLTGVGLWLLGVPLALTLALLAALLDFIPNIGPIVAAVPAVLIALAREPLLAVYVAALYTGVQLLEGFIITPLIQRRAAKVPPALLLTTQIVFGLLLGPLGLLLATPLVAAAIVLTRMVYVEGVLEQPRPSGEDGD